MLQPTRDKIIYGYIRISTDKQEVSNQRYQIENFAKANNILINEWVEETISSRIALEKRELFGLLEKMQQGDTMIACELSRLGRNLMQIMSILHGCLTKDVQVWTIKDNYRLGNDISSKVLAFAFGLSAEIERNLISQRTKEALQRKKSEGAKLGRPIGSNSGITKLTGKEAEIKGYLDKNLSYSSIARLLDCHRLTVSKFIFEKGFKDKKLISDSQRELYDNLKKLPDLDIAGSVELYEKGMSVVEIAAFYNLSNGCLIDRMRKAGIYPQIEAINKARRIEHPSKKYQWQTAQ